MEASGGALHVGVVEPHRFTRTALCKALSEAGLLVTGDFADIVSFLDHGVLFDTQVVVVDAQDPGELMVALRLVKERCLGIYALVFSDGGKGDAQACYDHGAAGYLDKRTADIPTLVHAIHQIARGERMFPLELLGSPFEMPAVHPEPPAPLRQVSTRERDVLSCLAAGADNLKIATLLRISERTVKAHISSLYRKLKVENRTQLALTALQLGLRPSTQV
jgi:two-component system nitrate/nitrite response regulator NarL